MATFGAGLTLACDANLTGPGDAGQGTLPPGAGSGGMGSTPGTSGFVSQAEEAAATCSTLGSELSMGRTPLRRLTRAQYDSTVQDLLGATGNPAQALAPDERIGPFPSNALTPITDLLVEQHHEVAVRLATQPELDATAVAGCNLATESTCAASFVATFGARAYRRPLTTSEVAGYVALYEAALESATLDTSDVQAAAQVAFSAVVETMLQSPHFLYHVEVGSGDGSPSSPAPLTAFELANRLSYFLWNTMPDEELTARATDGSLLTDAVLAAQAARLLAHDRAGATIARFHLDLLRVGDMAGVEKDPVLFPEYGPTLAQAMVLEFGHFADSVIRGEQPTLAALFTSRQAVMPAELWSIYGVERPLDDQEGALTELPVERGGLLTRAAFLTAQAHRDQTSPVHRGLTVRENLLCQPLPSPPANVNNVPPAPTAATTTRERFAQHSSDPACAHCHTRMDPIGLGFENYDPIGRFRATDGPSPVDASGEVSYADAQTEGTFVGAVELGQKLGSSTAVGECIASQWFRFSLGRMEAPNDACSMTQIFAGFAGSGHDVRELVLQIVQSDAFRHVVREAAAESP